MTKKSLIAIFVFFIGFATTASAGFESACVPDDMIPWSGYWWPDSRGALVNGYSAEPSPFEKYDAYVKGYFPDEITKIGLEREYDPDAEQWYGHCDHWAAASVLEPEPSFPGQLKGIPFRVGDKKGLLTAFYQGRFSYVTYGNPNYGGDDTSDIYPGGVQGFHQTLISYISIQGLPIIMDIDPGEAVWNHPAYRYEMNWTDSGDTRNVQCKVWMAANNVSPDFVGTQELVKTYNYSLKIDGTGEILDSEPGEWIGDSINSHPDYLWFPGYVDVTTTYLDEDVVNEIVACVEDGSDDRFESNNSMQTAALIEDSVKDQFFWGSAQDEDWYEVPLKKGDDFYAYLMSPSEDLVVAIYDSSGNEVGKRIRNGAKISEVETTDDYYVSMLPGTSEKPYYNIEFFVSPSDYIPHLAFGGNWETSVTALGDDWLSDTLRVNVLEKNGGLVDKKDIPVLEGKRVLFSMNDIFSEAAGSAKTAKLIKLDSLVPPLGFFSYSTSNQLLNIPLGLESSKTLIIPEVNVSSQWFTAASLMNAHQFRSAEVNVTAYSADGAVVGQNSFELGACENKVGLITDFCEISEATAWIEFTSDEKLQGSVLWATTEKNNSAGLAGIPLLRANHMGEDLYVAHMATTDGWGTNLTLVNPNSQLISIDINGYSSSTGRKVAENTLEIASKGNWSGSIQELFGEEWTEKVSWCAIESSIGMEIAGYQIFSQGLDGLAALPLFPASSLKEENTIIFPETGASIVGIAMVNPVYGRTLVWAEPFDADGNKLLGEDEYIYYNGKTGMAWHRNAVGIAGKLFPGLPAETVSMKIYSDYPIAGFGLFQNASEGKLDILYLE